MNGYDHRVRGTSLDDPSGAARAQQAHDAGAVVPPLEEPTFEVQVAFCLHGPQAAAQELVEGLTANLAHHPLVSSPVSASVTER